jgi:hypothetical protein
MDPRGPNTLVAFYERHGLKPTACWSDVSPGWVELLDRLVVDIKALGWDGDLHQVKEKFGGLRFYIGAGTPAMDERIDAAERESLRTCDMCGALGKLRAGGWLRTLCDTHASGRAETEAPNIRIKFGR